MEQPTKSCKRCGIEKTFDEFPREPRVRDGVANRCRECTRAYKTQWRERNGEHTAAYQREYRQRNIERIRELAREWRAAHPKAHNVHNQRRRALKRALTEDDRLYEAVLRSDPCAYCGAEDGGIDHMIPTSRGGEGGWQNLTACCTLCNARKNVLPMWLFLLRTNTDEGAQE